jgi:hypothetical protein
VFWESPFTINQNRTCFFSVIGYFTYLYVFYYALVYVHVSGDVIYFIVLLQLDYKLI